VCRSGLPLTHRENLRGNAQNLNPVLSDFYCKQGLFDVFTAADGAFSRFFRAFSAAELKAARITRCGFDHKILLPSADRYPDVFEMLVYIFLGNTRQVRQLSRREKTAFESLHYFPADCLGPLRWYGRFFPFHRPISFHPDDSIKLTMRTIKTSPGG